LNSIGQFGKHNRIWKILNFFQAREVLRELIVLLGMELAASPKSLDDCLAPLVGDLIELRENFRQKKHWEAADAVRQCLERSGAIIEDTENGTQWRLKS
jgi:cysteinyl-tRNA synthetase